MIGFTLVRGACVLGAFAACIALAFAQTENDPHYQPVKAVGPQQFGVITAAGRGTVRYFTNGSLEGGTDARRAIINIPGLLRNSDVYERSAEAAVAAAGFSPKDVLVVTPQFLAAIDVKGNGLPPDTLRWDVQTWLDGTSAIAPAAISAFEALDAMIARLKNPFYFPRLEEIVVLGHSAGGQLVQRYAVVGKGGELAAIRIHYIVANPSSYVYFDRVRPTPAGQFAVFSDNACPGFDSWKYGFENPVPYIDGVTAGYETQYVGRRVSYLLGGLDTDPNHPVLDRSCAAEAQGAYRLARGLNYFRYLHLRHPTGIPKQDLAVVRGVGHDAEKMFASACGLSVIFEGLVGSHTACASYVGMDRAPRPGSLALNEKGQAWSR